MINLKLLLALGAAPGVAARFVEPLKIAAERYNINTPLRVAAWLSQLAHESSRFARLSENLNYSAFGLAKTWPRRFAVNGAPNALAMSLAHKPEQIANNAYANRMGNGPQASGDGWKYRGGGLIQVTGKDNYRACGIALGVDLIASPEVLRTELYAALSAGWFWQTNNLNTLADRGDVISITKRINGGETGLADRQELYNTALKAIKEGT